MEPELLDVLREALEKRQRKEELERSIGRALRRRGLGFDAYVSMTSELRELARLRRTDLDGAAAVLLGEQKDECEQD